MERVCYLWPIVAAPRPLTVIVPCGSFIFYFTQTHKVGHPYLQMLTISSTLKTNRDQLLNLR